MGTRLEKVVLDLEDRFRADILQDAAAVAVLRKEVDRLSASGVRSARASRDIDSGITRVGTSSRRTGNDINQLTGRIRLFLDLAAMMGSGFVPIAAIGVPALTGIATAAAAAGTAGIGALVAFRGVGDALKAVEKARLEPTVENLEAAQKAMAMIGPDAQAFVTAWQELRPVMRELRDAAAEGLFPGLTESLDSFEDLAPKLERILRNVNEASGEAIARGADSLTTDRWRPFFNFLSREMPAAVTSLSRIIGDLTHGLAQMWMEFDPGNDSFLHWLEGVADGFDKWASSAQATEGIEDFLTYVAETGPMVADLFGSLVNLLVQISQAAAPIGGPVLQALTAIADVLAAIADSDAGTEIIAAAAAMTMLSRASKGFDRLNGTMWVQNVKGANGYMNTLAAVREGAIRSAAGIGLLATSMTDLDERAGLANTTTGGLLGTLLKGGKGGAIGAAIGLTLDLASANDTLAEATTRASTAAASGDLGAQKQELAALEQQLAKLDAAKDNFWSVTPAEGQSLVDKIKADMSVIGDVFTDAGEKGAAARAELLHNIMLIESGLQQIMDGVPGDKLATLLGAPLGEIDRSFEIATMSAAEFQAQVEELNGVLSGRASLRDYEASIDAATEALKENGKTLDRDTEAGRANEAALDAIATTSLRVAEGMKAAQRVNFLRGARKEFVDAAVGFGMTQDAARALANELGLLGKTKVEPPELDLDDKPAREKLTRTERAMRAWERGNYEAALKIMEGPAFESIDRIKRGLKDIPDETVNVNIKRGATIIGNAGDKIIDVIGGAGADGMTVPGPRHPYGDKTLIWAAPGEEVISNRHGEADQYRVDRAAGRIPRYADGGFVGASSPNPLNSTFSGALLADLRVELQDLFEDYRQRRREFLQSERPDTAKDLRVELKDLRDDYHERRRAFLRDEASRRDFNNTGRGHGGGRSLEDRLEILNIVAGMRDLKRQLGADGKDKLEGIRRRIAELDLQRAEKELRLARHREEREALQEARAKAKETRANLLGVGAGFSLDDLVPDRRPATVLGGARAEIRQLRAEIEEAGGHWTRGLGRWAKGLVAAASELDDVNAAIARETERRDELQKALQDQQQALDQLASTMQSFSDSVASNFLTNSLSRSSGGAVNPELVEARAQLAAIRGSSTGDSVAVAAQASELIARIRQLEETTGESLTGLAGLRQTLARDTADAQAMAQVLAQLEALGLDTTGDRGGLYRALASSGDLVTAQQLAALGAAGVDELEGAFADRENAAAQLAAETTQAIYGQQYAMQQAALALQQMALDQANMNLTTLANHQVAIEAAIRNMGPDVATALQPQIEDLARDVRHVGEDTAEKLRRMLNK